MRHSENAFLHKQYDALCASERQCALRRMAPMPVGVVFIQWPGMDESAVRAQFRLMKSLGFNCLKGIHTTPGTSRREVMHWALDEGLIPWWYGEGGYAPITDELLDELGISRDASTEAIRADSRFMSYQEHLLRERIDREAVAPRRKGGWSGKAIHSPDHTLSSEAVFAFTEWLQQTYTTLEALEKAWNFSHAAIQKPPRRWERWDEVRADLPRLFEEPKEYRRIRDVLRFKADQLIAAICEKRDVHRAGNPYAPFRAGGEMGLFLPFGARATDMEGIAEAMAAGGSFYPSIHLSWHFEETDFSLMPEVFLQASVAADWFKGGWSAPWESTGGPQQLSGGKGLAPGSEKKRPGFTVDEGVITQLMLSYLAAGFRGFGFWCWSARTAGWEAGEFSLLDRNNQPGARARVAGAIGAAAVRYRDELWQAHKEPLVGVFTDFENEAMWAAISVAGRDLYKSMGVQGRIGAGRALCKANIPWEHVSGANIRRGLVDRYRCIVLPSIVSLSNELLELLAAYVERGGRLAMDLPGLWLDEYGRLTPTGTGSLFERIFGCTLDDYQFASNVPRILRGCMLDGFVCDCTPSSGRVIESYESGKPAIIENNLGDGSAILLGYEASQMCFQRNLHAEHWFPGDCLGALRPGFECEGVYAWRLATPVADHYFLVNDGDTRTVTLTIRDYAGGACHDAVTGEFVDCGAIEVPAHNGRWIRGTRS